MPDTQDIALPPSGIIAQVDSIRQALSLCRTDFERLAIRDKARAVSAAAKILKRRDVQSQASWLVADAERLIAKANPPKPPRERSPGRLGNTLPREQHIPRETLSKIRAAHAMPDETYEAAKAESLESSEPITRKALLGVSRKHKTDARRAKRPNPPPPSDITADRRYRVILADPPWRYDFHATDRRAIENQYPTMPIDEICDLPIPDLAKSNSILFLWATSPKLPEALSVVKAWGFEYKTCAVWVKDRIGTGYYFRQRHELLLVAKKGSPKVPEPANRRDSVFEFPRREHSRKPDSVYEAIERMYPGIVPLELFSRRPRDGWHAWGNESGP